LFFLYAHGHTESRCQETESRNYELEQTVKTLMKRIESLELTNIHENRIMILSLLFFITVLVTYGYFSTDHTVDMLFDIVKHYVC
jgi:hypothetical protein